MNDFTVLPEASGPVTSRRPPNPCSLPKEGLRRRHSMSYLRTMVASPTDCRAIPRTLTLFGGEVRPGGHLSMTLATPATTSSVLPYSVVQLLRRNPDATLGQAIYRGSDHTSNRFGTSL